MDDLFEVVGEVVGDVLCDHVDEQIRKKGRLSPLMGFFLILGAAIVSAILIFAAIRLF